MNFSRHRSWPHPVLTPLGDDISPNDFEFNLEVQKDHPKWRIQARAIHADSTMEKLLKQGLAEYLLHIECKRTFFRKVFSSTSKNFDISIPGDELYGDVEVAFLVIASKDILTYSHPDQHKDYEKRSFRISIGEPLAVAITQSFEAFLEADPILNLSSILDIRRSLESRLMRVDCEAGNRIVVELPSADFERYRNLRSDFSVRGLLASTVVFPAILHSLHYLRILKNNEEELSDFKANHSWSRSLLLKIESLGIDISDENGAGCFEAAQQLMKDPFHRCLDDLTAMFLN